MRRKERMVLLGGAVAFAALPSAVFAAQTQGQLHGQVTFSGEPVPGATVTVTQGLQKLSTVTDQSGLYSFPSLPDGVWKIEIAMLGFATLQSQVAVAPATPPARWELMLLPLDKIMAQTKVMPTVTAGLSKPVVAGSPNNAHADSPKPAEDANQQDGFLVNGSVNNAATSRFSLDQAFGNKRSNSKSLYSGGLAAIYDNSATDAKPYSLSGIDTPKPSYNRITGLLTLSGPINIPRVLPHGPTFFLAYQWMRDRTAATESGLVPTAAERGGDLAGVLDALGAPVVITNPATGLPFAGNVVPVSAQAQALLRLYPLPNIANNSLYNYQVPVLDSSHQDELQSRLDKSLGRKDQVYGNFGFSSTRASTTDLLGFTDRTNVLGLDASIHWSHRFSQHLFVYAGYRFSRLRTTSVPYFQNSQNISGDAGIGGNNQGPAYWGPPTLNFSSGITALSDAQSSFNRNRTDAFSGSVGLYRGHHNITLGGDLRKQQFNDLFQQDPRGTFTFTGAATQGAAGSVTTGGSDLADFLLGVPDTSSIAFGNADKYLREPVYDLYAADDWRILSDLTIDYGMRWQYGAPITELYDRLVNLDVTPGFASVAPVLASDPLGALTGSRYPSSLIRPDKLGFEPRVGISWRPIPASTIVIRAGYGIYHDTSVYQAAALALAQQQPLSKSLSVQNSAACPLTLANGFQPCSSTTTNTFAVDPNFRVGYAQTWQLSVQRDLPAALQLTATYLGVKGAKGVQQFLPNTYPIGAVNPCPACPAGFLYQASGGNSTRESAQVQLRRRLRSGFTASLLYTFSKSVDDDSMLGGQGPVSTGTQGQGSTASAAPGGAGQGASTASGSTQSAAATTPSIAQNWLDLRGERSLSAFDQRHLLNLQAQYTSGEGLTGGTLLSGWPGRLLKEWTVLTQIVAGTGLPETPVYLAAVPGTGFTGTIRPNRTGASIYAQSPGLSILGRHLNAAAYVAPAPGAWGTAGRNSITGPTQFSLDTSLARTFRPGGRFYLDARVSATNLLNHVTFTGWDTTVNSTQYGVPLAAEPMRSLETTVRLRF